jgi:transposase
MRKLQDFVVRSKDVFIGLEDSKRTWKVCVRSENMVVNESSMPAQYPALSSYLRNKFPECRIRLVYEAGFKGFNLHDKLTADGIDCIVTPPNKVTEEKCNKVKTDRTDARRLAKNLENDDCAFCSVPDKERREHRQYSRSYESIKRATTICMNQIRRFLEFHGLDEGLKPGAWTIKDYEAVREMVMSDTLRMNWELLFERLYFLRKQRAVVRKQLQQLSVLPRYKDTVRRFSSCPGIGAITAIRLALEWGDIERFDRKETFGSYLGLTPGEFSSGERERKGHITRQGNGMIRYMLTESAWIAIRHDPILLDKFQKVWHRSGSKKKAIVAVAHKIGLRLWALERLKQEYVVGLAA